MPLSAVAIRRSLSNDAVEHLPQRPACCVRPQDSVAHAVQCMAALGVSCAMVVDNGKLAGIFTERDFVGRVVAKGVDAAVAVADVMTPKVCTVASGASVLDVIALMHRSGCRHVPVIDPDGNPRGVLTVKDVIHCLVEYFPAKVYNLPPTPELAQPAREGA